MPRADLALKRPLGQAWLVLCLLLFLLLPLFLPNTAQAQGYSPDVAEFDGSSSLGFAPSEALYVAEAATIEFWVSPDWSSPLDYDPVVLSFSGEQGATYLVAVLRELDGLVLVSAGQRFFIPYQFEDSQMRNSAMAPTNGAVEPSALPTQNPLAGDSCRVNSVPPRSCPST